MIKAPMIDGPGKGTIAGIAPWGAVAVAREATWQGTQDAVLYRPLRCYVLGHIVTVLTCAEGEPNNRDLFTAIVNPELIGGAERVKWQCQHTLHGEAPCPLGCHDMTGEDKNGR